MGTPSSTFTELVTTTFRKHRKEIKDNISNHNALLQRIYKKGNVRYEDGGLSIVEPLDYASNNTYQRYSGYDTLNISASEVISAAEYAWKQIAIHVTASGLELRTNSGDSRIINLAKARIKNAIRTFKNSFSSDMFSAGSLSNQINGLQALVSKTPSSGTVGGINAATIGNEFWRNVAVDASAVSITPSTTAGVMESFLLNAWLQVTHGDDTPDLIIADDTYFSYYEGGLVGLKRYTTDDKGEGGFTSLKYKGTDVIYDNGGIPDATIYMLNTNYLYLVAHPDADMTELTEMRAINQDAVVIPILWMGNLVCSNRRNQAVLFD